jgi:hypothetical protein
MKSADGAGQRISQILKNDLGGKESYQHAPKRGTPGKLVETNRSRR